MSQAQRYAIALPVGITFGLILAYMLAWYDVPLFYDEVSFRLYNGRAFIDGFLQRSFYPQCLPGDATSPLLLPAHSIFSWIDGWTDWRGVRTLPMVVLGVLLALVGRTIIEQSSRRNTWEVLLLCGAFIGISGLSMVLSRPEYAALLHVACIFATWLLARRATLGIVSILVAVVVILLITSLSLQAHLQGVLLMPLSFITCMQLLRRHAWLAVLVAILMVALTVPLALKGFALQCPSDPALEVALKTTQGSGLAAQEHGPWIEKMAGRFVRFERQFFFRAQPAAFSLPLPGIPQRMVHALNIPVAAMVSLYLCALLMAMGVSVRSLVLRYRKGTWRGRLNALFADGQFLWLVAAVLLVAYSIYEASGTFYRAYFRHLLTVILVAIAATQVIHPRLRRLVKLWAFAGAVMCMLSALVAWVLIAPPLHKGYEGIGVSLQRDWPSLNADVVKLAERCGLTPGTKRVVIDDTTYAAMRHYPEPLSYNFLWFSEIVIKGALQQKSAQERLAIIRAQQIPGYVVRCDALERFGLPVDHRDGEVCCHAMR